MSLLALRNRQHLHQFNGRLQIKVKQAVQVWAACTARQHGIAKVKLYATGASRGIYVQDVAVTDSSQASIRKDPCPGDAIGK